EGGAEVLDRGVEGAPGGDRAVDRGAAQDDARELEAERPRALGGRGLRRGLRRERLREGELALLVLREQDVRVRDPDERDRDGEIAVPEEELPGDRERVEARVDAAH